MTVLRMRRAAPAPAWPRSWPLDLPGRPLVALVCRLARPRHPTAGAPGLFDPCHGASAVPLVVQKFGGTSVGDAERIRAVADHVARTGGLATTSWWW